MQHLKNHDYLIVVHGDKNLGSCILDRTFYIFKGFSEHLGNTRNYKELTKKWALCHQRGLKYQFQNWMSKYKPKEEPTDYVTISEAEFTFLYRALKFYPGKLARFRQTCKVHKTPWKLCPIICCASTFMNYWSRWLDYWLQKLKPLIPSYLNNGDQLLEEVLPLHIPSLGLLSGHRCYSNVQQH